MLIIVSTESEKHEQSLESMMLSELPQVHSHVPATWGNLTFGSWFPGHLASDQGLLAKKFFSQSRVLMAIQILDPD